MADPFDSAWLKWGQAIVHAQTLDAQMLAELERFQASQPFTTRTEYDAKRHAVVMRLVSIDPISDRIGLLLGDVANNFRASLDHLAWALVTTRPKRTVKRGEASRIYFPLCKSPGDFNTHLVASQLLQDRDRRIVRRFQPFWNTPRYRMQAKSKIDRHCFSVLPDINRDDKHKAIRAVWLWPKGGLLFVGDPQINCTITRNPPRDRGKALEPGADIGTRCGDSPGLCAKDWTEPGCLHACPTRR